METGRLCTVRLRVCVHAPAQVIPSRQLEERLYVLETNNNDGLVAMHACRKVNMYSHDPPIPARSCSVFTSSIIEPFPSLPIKKLK